MRTRSRLFTTLLVTVLAVASLATSHEGDEPVIELQPRTQTMFIAAGCPQDTPGTCTSTRWLGKTPGDATSNFITSITPVDEANYHVSGPNWRDYGSDNSWDASGYLLRSAEDIEATVGLSAQGPGALVTVHARISGFAGGSFVSFGEQQQTVQLMAPLSTTEVEFSFDIPEALEEKALTRATFEVAVHGVNVAAGYINQQGGSWLDIPYWLPVVVG